ncbi:Maf family protein [Suttonella indologenes]|uniref:7-methyl-GTP pyrophosphatase n=1 Tax=Suttonella indologenes TaxID=13276 RepID=A0A380N2L0_9GAMM|nr:nucleoside triphosphate pyrophosphatase [Suttonella indologenes]SUO98526.1 Septum formation protein Maf [Suttonella indologenes]
MEIILASTSPFRKAILENLRLRFSAQSPNIDESPLPHESPQALVERLARSKARAVDASKEAFVIGSDQVATIDGDILGKPHNITNAIAQLSRFSGREVQFFTGLCLRRGDILHSLVEPFSVQFRELSPAEIRIYVERELPLNSAGSFKSEGLGILLFSRLIGRDPNALIGLPLIALQELFAQYRLNLLTDAPYLAQ